MKPATHHAEQSRYRHPDRRTLWQNGLVDSALFTLAVAIGSIAYVDAIKEIDPSIWVHALIIVSGLLCCTSIYFRRIWPVQIAVVASVASAINPFAGVVSLVGIFTVASRRPWKFPVAVAALHLILTPIYYALYVSGGLNLTDLLLTVLVLAVAVAWGMFVGARRQLVDSLRARAVQAEADRDLRLAQAREQERTRIAREMHDVLAHRISLVALNAGALEFRPDASPEEVREAAAIVRSNAHQALEELRDVISVLRDDESEGSSPAEPPQPTLVNVEALIEESRQSGVEVEFEESIEESTLVPAATGRTAYRVVQEGLTNARKHAPGGAALVSIGGTPGDGLTVEISNRRPLVEPVESTTIPGSGTGLIGLTERVELAGGNLTHGPRPDGRFTLRAWLPWVT